MKYAYVALAGAVLAGDAVAFAPVSVPSVRGATTLRMAQEAPPAKLELPKAKVEASAVNAKQWGTKSGAAMPELPASTYEPRPYDAVAAGHVQAPAVVRQTMAAFATAGAAAASGSATQSPPPAKLELPKAKLEAAAVNAQQWGTGASGASSGASGASLSGDGTHQEQLEAAGYKIIAAEGKARAPVPKPAAKPKAAPAPEAAPAPKEAPAPVATKGTQAPPPAKLELPKAKLEAAAVNEKQWINPPAVPAAEKQAPLLDERSTTVSEELAAAIRKLETDFAAANAAGTAALPRAIEAQAAMSNTVSSYGDKLKMLAASATSKLGTSTPRVAVGPNDLSKFREDSVNSLKNLIAK
eukprot:Tamp_11564.p1 GENE.Tamp_11564~~Tamp_11564.p1  ORF type:complete len:366 (-),score=80.06 Tamp_11564:806-1870(-)